MEQGKRQVLIKSSRWLVITQVTQRVQSIQEKPERALIIMTRVPVARETKTRLMTRFTGEECVAFHEACLEDLNRLQQKINIPVYISYTGSLTDKFISLFSENVRYIPQGEGDLGVRMAQAFFRVLSSYKHVVMIGSDIPNLTESHLEGAFAGLESGKDLVFGPALDGGYYLIGMNNFHSEVFEGIIWSRADVLEKTIKRVQESGLSYSLLEKMRDLDTYEDLLEYTRNPENASTRAWQMLQEHLTIAKA